MENSIFQLSILNILNKYGLQGIGYSIVIIVIYIAFNKPENFKIWGSWIYNFLGGMFSFLRKKAVKFSIEGPCTKALKRISKELPEMEIPDLNIKWVNEDNALTRLKEGKAIVKLRFSNDQSRNIIKATTVYVRDAFLNHSKPYLSVNFKRAIDFSISKKILLNITNNQRNIISQFIEDNVSIIGEIQEECNSIEEIDDSGLFTRILIRELDYYGTKLTGRIPNQDHYDESAEFLKFLHDIAIREPDDFTPLSFDRQFFKVGVLLVAKLDTFSSHGLDPYLRRIKLGLAKGIETFYLLARDDKVEILQTVATELLNTGNFTLINNPKEYRDIQNRATICYCLRINKDSLLANSLKQIGDAIKEQIKLNAVITKVREDYIQLDCFGIEGYVKRDYLSILEIKDARLYFKESSYIEAIPLEIQQNGTIEFTLKGTSSDPNYLINKNFEIKKVVSGKITYIDDTFLKVDIGDEKIEGIAFRKNLTYSRFLLLTEKFEIGEEYEFIVHSYDFERARIRLVLKELSDPWNKLRLHKKLNCNLSVYKKSTKSFIGEISEGIEAILPYNELAWFESEIDNVKNSIKLNNEISCYVKEFDLKTKLILLTLKNELNNPYNEFLKSNKDSIVEFIIKEINEFGILGTIESKYDIFIPKYEQSWNGINYKYKVGNKYKVYIKGKDKHQFKLIGSFKPVIPHPLKDFTDNYKEGQPLKTLNIIEKYDWGTTFKIKDSKKEYEGLLFSGDISESCYIQSSKEVLKNIDRLPLVIKTIDCEKNRIVLSLKLLTEKNVDRITSLSYEKNYSSLIIGESNYSYVVLITGFWIEGILETEKKYNIGEIIKLRPSRIDETEIVLTDQ